jgi:hypothetical protein
MLPTGISKSSRFFRNLAPYAGGNSSFERFFTIFTKTMPPPVGGYGIRPFRPFASRKFIVPPPVGGYGIRPFGPFALRKFIVPPPFGGSGIRVNLRKKNSEMP